MTTDFRNPVWIRENAWQDDSGAWHWNSNDAVIPLDCLEEAGFDFDPAVQQNARDAELRDLVQRMREAEDRMTDEERAERDFEMRAAFGEGTTVVNVLTGRKINL